MDANMDLNAYVKAVNELKNGSIQGPHGTYHVKNGVVHYGYNIIAVSYTHLTLPTKRIV